MYDIYVIKKEEENNKNEQQVEQLVATTITCRVYNTAQNGQRRFEEAKMTEQNENSDDDNHSASTKLPTHGKNDMVPNLAAKYSEKNCNNLNEKHLFRP